MKNEQFYLALILDEQRYAIPVCQVERVVRAVEVTPVPDRPGIMIGIINLGGVIIPVINFRKRLHLPARAMDISDQFVIAKTTTLTVALVVDAVEGVVCAQEPKVTEREDIFPGLGILQGVLKTDDRILLIRNLEDVLAPDLAQSCMEIMAHHEEGSQ